MRALDALELCLCKMKKLVMTYESFMVSMLFEVTQSIIDQKIMVVQ